jgi:hypothetical protein
MLFVSQNLEVPIMSAWRPFGDEEGGFDMGYSA